MISVHRPKQKRETELFVHWYDLIQVHGNWLGAASVEVSGGGL